MSISYHKSDATIVFKTSNRSNAKTKMKTYRNKTVDDIISAKKLIGVPDNAIIVEIGFGDMFEEQWKRKYKL
jgi:hypothetical protein